MAVLVAVLGLGAPSVVVFRVAVAAALDTAPAFPTICTTGGYGYGVLSYISVSNGEIVGPYRSSSVVQPSPVVQQYSSYI